MKITSTLRRTPWKTWRRAVFQTGQRLQISMGRNPSRRRRSSKRRPRRKRSPSPRGGIRVSRKMETEKIPRTRTSRKKWRLKLHRHPSHRHRKRHRPKIEPLTSRRWRHRPHRQRSQDLRQSQRQLQDLQKRQQLLQNLRQRFRDLRRRFQDLRQNNDVDSSDQKVLRLNTLLLWSFALFPTLHYGNIFGDNSPVYDTGELIIPLLQFIHCIRYRGILCTIPLYLEFKINIFQFSGKSLEWSPN